MLRLVCATQLFGMPFVVVEAIWIYGTKSLGAIDGLDIIQFWFGEQQLIILMAICNGFACSFMKFVRIISKLLSRFLVPENTKIIAQQCTIIIIIRFGLDSAKLEYRVVAYIFIRYLACLNPHMFVYHWKPKAKCAGQMRYIASSTLPWKHKKPMMRMTNTIM